MDELLNFSRGKERQFVEEPLSIFQRTEIYISTFREGLETQKYCFQNVSKRGLGILNFGFAQKVVEMKEVEGNNWPVPYKKSILNTTKHLLLACGVVVFCSSESRWGHDQGVSCPLVTPKELKW